MPSWSASSGSGLRCRRRSIRMRCANRAILTRGHSGRPRRDAPALLITLALALLVAPLAVGAQSAAKVTRIGYLSLFEPRPLDDVFRQGLRELGWVEGQNLIIEYRSAGGDLQRVRPLAEELVRLGVALIVTTTGRATLVVKNVTDSVPIVMTALGTRSARVSSRVWPGQPATSPASRTFRPRRSASGWSC
jgi:hypothetical protein